MSMYACVSQCVWHVIVCTNVCQCVCVDTSDYILPETLVVMFHVDVVLPHSEIGDSPITDCAIGGGGGGGGIVQITESCYVVV